jgi:hypothetical protein
MSNYDREESPGMSTAVGSVAANGHRLYQDDDTAEQTSLLGAGAEDNIQPRERQDSWVGWQDFQDIPPWRRPSVCRGTPKDEARSTHAAPD